jgi:hypothetical protein
MQPCDVGDLLCIHVFHESIYMGRRVTTVVPQMRSSSMQNNITSMPHTHALHSQLLLDQITGMESVAPPYIGTQSPGD